jgi:amino acid adenylation domain-containing protein
MSNSRLFFNAQSRNHISTATEAEKEAGRLASRNGAKLTFSREKLVHELVSCRAMSQPDAVAVIAGERVVTYGQLEERSNRLAHQLQSLGVGPEAVVGLCLQRSISSVVGALAILKAGGAYLPLDPENPAQRIAFQLKQTSAAVVVAAQCQREQIPRGEWHVIGLDPEGQTGFIPKTSETLASRPTVDNLAYVIYTSGSTGEPKGVEIKHESLLNLVSWHQEAFGITAADRGSHLANVGFDAAVWEIWPYLASGASLHVVEDCVRNDPAALKGWLVSRKITVSFVPTPIAERLMVMDWPTQVNLRLLLTGADTLHHYPTSNLPFTLVNNYGPTECTVVATSGAVNPNHQEASLPPIGRPISNVQIYLLDNNMKPVPVGVTGELYIGGVGVARGYRNRQDLTAERFVPNPFGSSVGERLYRTGDLARLLPDGQVLFIGRTDDQIKIHGYRIEPNEIVTALKDHPAIVRSFVTARELQQGGSRLVAYLETSPSSRLTQESLRQFLSSRLPEHMIPHIFVRLEALPLNARGKVDRTALPEPTSVNTLRNDVFSTPRTVVAQKLTEILAPLLGLDRISVEDNFFTLGGHSLLGTQLIARVRDTFGVSLSLRALFDAPTIADLAGQIEKMLVAKLGDISNQEGLSPSPQRANSAEGA